ncbi:VOC family protein [Aureimonas altamirensis]|uniref:VOC family protein n=1 Tax=Aureimonas altamirensis TaxID=370622 RepID=UPI001E390BDE|nr:VOC family protein [Aureimonas altamirensis]UHD44001.1 VOC family protein [Aureimonas altamirensis]
MKGKISIVTLGVTDLARATNFYEALGFKRYPFDAQGVAFFELDGSWLSLYPREALADDAGVAPAGVGFRGITLAHNVAEKGDVDTALAEAERVGARIVKQATDVFWGGRSGYFADPDGFLWEVAWNPLIDLT